MPILWVLTKQTYRVIHMYQGGCPIPRTKVCVCGGGGSVKCIPSYLGHSVKLHDRIDFYPWIHRLKSMRNTASPWGSQYEPLFTNAF
jgi:hypothetical protein